MVDAGGTALPWVAAGSHTNAARGTEYVLTCQPQKGQGEPAKLVYTVSQSVTIDIPFTLRNVPLP
jgi:hypothetical protein